jgi:4-amino-4-deoxy-L-arabinose transferase-like glycosyltransferase
MSIAPADERKIGRQKSRFVFLCSLLVLLGFALRVFYAFDAKPENPILGDINEYVLYAWNLHQTGTFSSTLPNNELIVADSYRGPGYPLMLAGAMSLAGNAKLYLRDAGGDRSSLVADPSTWVSYSYLTQALLGALSVLLTIAIARKWLGTAASLSAGLIVALWPHSIVFSATLLSETLFGFLLLLSLWLLSNGQQNRNPTSAAVAGLAFGVSYLVNPILALFPLFAAMILIRQKSLRLGTVFLVAYLVIPLAWIIRNATIESPHGAGARVAQNFVQGSWPQFLTALNSRFSNEISAQIVEAEVEEERAFIADPRIGIDSVLERMSLDPGYYASWYLLKKPFLLWDWKLGVGWGDIYFLATPNSPFERIPILKATKQLFAGINPALFALAALTAVGIAIKSLTRRSKIAFPLAATAWMALYLTAVHTVLQAEPRYSIPYRPMEILLAVTAITWLCDYIQKQWLRRNATLLGRAPTSVR